jgi:hypothetical protein
MEVVTQCFKIDGNELAKAKSASRMLTNDTDCPLCNSQQPTQPPLALSVPLSRFTSRVGAGSAFYVRPLAHIAMKNALMIVLCSAVILVSGCTSPDSHSRTMDVASLPGDTPDKVLSQITGMLSRAGIQCNVTLGAFGSEPARYDIHVSADKQAEAANLLKQDAAIHKYEIKIIDY